MRSEIPTIADIDFVIKAVQGFVNADKGLMLNKITLLSEFFDIDARLPAYNFIKKLEEKRSELVNGK